MKVFALSDPHLSFSTPNKAMDRFGAHWVGHPSKIAERWRERVGADDLVLVTGDVSWAMTLEQAQADLDYLGALPGTKVLVKGNHDYWWSTISKVRRALPPSVRALQGDAVRIGDVAIGGTRLWDAPGVSFHDWIDWQPAQPGGAISAERTLADEEESKKIWERELGRLVRALEALDRAAGADALRIAATHYPPCGPALEPTVASERIARAGARFAVFGHLHSLRRDRGAPFGERDGVRYVLAACDWIDFAPVEVASP